MAWFADLAGKAESLLNNIDEQTGAALRSHKTARNKKPERIDLGTQSETQTVWPKKKEIKNIKKNTLPARPLNKSPTFTEHINRPSNQRLPSKQNTSKQSLPDDRRRSSPDRQSKRSPGRLPYSLHNSPKTLVSEIKDEIENVGPRQRRHSIPESTMMKTESLTYRMQNLEVENTMMKNELNVLNKEVSELLARLRKTEDELEKTIDCAEAERKFNEKLLIEKDELNDQLVKLKLKMNDLTTNEVVKQKEIVQDLQAELNVLRLAVKDIQEKLQFAEIKKSEMTTANLKLENELRHTQTQIQDLQNSYDRSQTECQRLEQDWEAYKLRVKNMLLAKDNQIKMLQEGNNLTEDTKILIEEVDRLKEEREDLIQSIHQVKAESNGMKRSVQQLENKASAAERRVEALKDAIKDERANRIRIEQDYYKLSKDYKSMEAELTETIAKLRTNLQEKESDLTRIRDTMSTSNDTMMETLNVGDYDVVKEDDNKIEQLTQLLVQKQGRIDELLANNNVYRIQLDKLENKYKIEIANLKAGVNHSVVTVDHDARHRVKSRSSDSTMKTLSLRIGVFIRRYPIFRPLIMLYMVGLHLWVLTVLFSSTPDNLNIGLKV